MFITVFYKSLKIEALQHKFGKGLRTRLAAMAKPTLIARIQ